MAATGSDETGCRQETASRQNRSSWRRIVSIVILISRHISRLESSVFQIAQDARPELDTVAQRQGVGMGRAFLRTRENVKSTEDHFCTPRPVPICELIGAAGKRQMHRDSDNLRHRVTRWTSVQKVLIPIFDPPVVGCCCSKTGERESGCEDVFAEAGVGVFCVEGVDEQRIPRVDGPGLMFGGQRGCRRHFLWNPTWVNPGPERLVEADHAEYFILQSTSCQRSRLRGRPMRCPRQQMPRCARNDKGLGNKEKAGGDFLQPCGQRFASLDEGVRGSLLRSISGRPPRRSDLRSSLWSMPRRSLLRTSLLRPRIHKLPRRRAIVSVSRRSSRHGWRPT